MMTDHDRSHLERYVQFDAEALDASDEPFGAILVSADGATLLEAINEVGGGDAMQHLEFAIARWAAEHLAPAERAATVYTSGEHCPMCSAAPAWVGLGRIVYAPSAAELAEWQAESGATPSPVRSLWIDEVAPGISVNGPSRELAEQVHRLHQASWLKRREA